MTSPLAQTRTVETTHYTFEVSYGKHGVSVYRVFATPLRDVAPIPESSFTGRDNNLLACEVDVEVFGEDFLPAYTHGDNTMLVATDSMKNFIIRESLTYPGATLEGLLHFLGIGFATTYPQMHTLTLTGREIPFTPVVVPDGEGGHQPGGNLFSRGRGDRAFASLSVDKRGDEIVITGHDCGLTGIELMKLTGSAFTSFVRDDYTTLPERGDRPLYVSMDVGWQYADPQDMLDLTRSRYVPAEQMRDLIAATFDDFVSESIQHLLHEMGRRAFERFPQLAALRFDALNRTRDPYGQREDDPRVKVYSDPFPAYGRLTLAMRREIGGNRELDQETLPMAGRLTTHVSIRFMAARRQGWPSSSTGSTPRATRESGCTSCAPMPRAEPMVPSWPGTPCSAGIYELVFGLGDYFAAVGRANAPIPFLGKVPSALAFPIRTPTTISRSWPLPGPTPPTVAASATVRHGPRPSCVLSASQRRHDPLR